MLIARILIATSALVACSSSGIAQRIENVNPFRELGVRLGMSASDLSAVRKHAQFAPYAGYRESQGENDIIYSFPGTEDELAIGARLVRVAISRTIRESPSHASAQFQQAKARYTRDLGQPTRCGEMRLPLDTAEVAQWIGRDVAFEVGLWRNREGLRIVLVVQQAGETAIPASSENCGG
jgi:hypothetical protein